MGWRLIDRPRTQKVTRALAMQFASMDTIPDDRPLRERRMTVYRKMLAEGGFRPVTWARCRCKETGAMYRVNGKHTSTMLASTDHLPEFYVTIEDYEADTLKEVAALYSTFDSQAQTRTARDIYLSFAGTVPELRDVPIHILTTVAGAIPYARIQERCWNMTAPERAEMLLDQSEFILWADSIIRPPGQKSAHAMLRRIAVMAAMLLTWEKDPGAATMFWERVRDETGPSPDDPDRRLAKFLTIMSINRGTGSRIIASRKLGDREFFVKSLHAWNAWRKGVSHTLRYVIGAELPKAC